MEKLIELLNNTVNDYETEIQSIISSFNSTLDDYNLKKQKLNKLKRDNKYIVEYSEKEILNMINSIDMDAEELSEEDIQKMYSDIKYELDDDRKKLLFNILQVRYLTEYKMEIKPEQRATVEKFIYDSLIVIESLKKEDIEYRRKISKIKEKLDKIVSYRKELEDNPNNIITMNDVIRGSLLESSLSEEEKRNIIQSLFENNKRIYYEVMNTSLNTKTIVKEKIDKDELDSLLHEFGYNIDLLIYKNDEKYLDLLLLNGNLNNIKGVLESLSSNNITSGDFNLKNENSIRVFVSILCNSTAEDINNIISLSEENGITKSMLLKNPRRLINQVRESGLYTQRYYETEERDEYLLYGTGSNFISNINYFKSNGFDLKTISDKALSVLDSSPYLISYNSELFKLYGIKIPPISRGFSYSSLESTGSSELFDRFIEVCSNGYDYITKYLSRLLITNVYSPSFYKMYRKSKIAEDGKVKISDYTLDLYSEENLPIEKCNDIGNTIVPRVERKEEYDQIVNDSLHERKKAIFSGKFDFSKGNALYDYDILDDEIVKTLNDKNEYKEIYFENDKETSNRYIYNINGVRISKNKFLKTYNILRKNVNESNLSNIVLYCLTYNSIINEEEFKLVEDAVKKIVKTRKMV